MNTRRRWRVGKTAASSKTTMVRSATALPLRPLTEATDSGKKRSDGSTFAIGVYIP